MPKLTSKYHKYFWVRKEYAQDPKKKISGVMLTLSLRNKKSLKDAVKLAQEILTLKDKNIKYVEMVYNEEATFIGLGKFVVVANQKEEQR